MTQPLVTQNAKMALVSEATQPRYGNPASFSTLLLTYLSLTFVESKLEERKPIIERDVTHTLSVWQIQL